jgi:hypothetical protein
LFKQKTHYNNQREKKRIKRVYLASLTHEVGAGEDAAADAVATAHF